MKRYLITIIGGIVIIWLLSDEAGWVNSILFVLSFAFLIVCFIGTLNFFSGIVFYFRNRTWGIYPRQEWLLYALAIPGLFGSFALLALLFKSIGS